MSREVRIARKHRLLGDDYLLPSEREVLGDEEFAEDELDRADRFAREMDNSDQLVQKSRLIQAKQETLNQQAPFARINPVSVLSGMLGNQQLVNSNPATPPSLTATGSVAGQSVQVANWVGDDAETTPVTITLAPTQQATADPTFTSKGVGLYTPVRPYAIIQFGTTGFSVKAEIDIGLGCQLTVGASSVTVQVALEASGAGEGFAQMKLAGMLSFLATQRQTQITRTAYIDFLVADDEAEILVPPFAKNVILWREPITQPVNMFFETTSDFSGTSYEFDLAANAVMTEPVQLAGDITSIAVHNGVGAQLAHARLIFGLSF